MLWGLAFVATRIGLDSFSPPQLVALRFVIASVPAALVAAPRVGWPVVIAAGLTLYTGQFLFQFFGIANGMPPGLASLIVQTQALFTVLLAAVLLGERPTGRQALGFLIAFTGLALIATTTGHDLSVRGLALTLVSPVSFAIGNLILKRIGSTVDLALMAWMSLVPPLPAVAISLIADGPDAFAEAIAAAPWPAWAAAVYLGIVATVIAYTIWGNLLRRYPVSAVTPFALLVPFVGAFASSVVFGEQFGPVRLAGMGGVLLGLAVIVLPRGRRATAGQPPAAGVRS